jgi:ABC-type multidrug transport system fused ATPase/permease subunit
MFAAIFLIDINENSFAMSYNTTKVNIKLVSYKRIKSLLNIKIEKPRQERMTQAAAVNPENELDDRIVQDQIQEKSSIILNNFSLSYQNNLALKNISVEAKPGEKVALIGRTGSGKSSIVQGLLRLVEPSPESQYFINGENALSMDAADLRQQFACIPQTPFLFNDTLRKNIDPFGKYSDPQIEEALRKTCILDYIRQNVKLFLFSSATASTQTCVRLTQR